jgi:SAM-dependent methyltransferase
MKLTAVLQEVASLYPADMRSHQISDIPRTTFNMQIALEAIARPHTEVEICDIGGGIGLFSVGCAAYGMKRVVLVDDFQDVVNRRVGGSILDIHRKFGVEVIVKDVIEDGISNIFGQFDIFTCFDSMEHWHNSPKDLFHQIAVKMKPNGVFVLGVPNCVNLRKRIAVPLGIGRWSSLEDWYEEKRFRGHVREPNVTDLLYIAHDMNLSNIRIYGRNWMGYTSDYRAIRMATVLFDYPLRAFPSLCSHIYVIGENRSTALPVQV